MIKATMILKAGEEEFWANQHPQPYIFPDSPGGTSYERYECYKVQDQFSYQMYLYSCCCLEDSSCSYLGLEPTLA